MYHHDLALNNHQGLICHKIQPSSLTEGKVSDGKVKKQTGLSPYDWLVWFYGISTFVGYLTPIPFLYK